MNIKIPQQFAMDPEVSEVYRQYKNLQKEFKETHKTLDKLQGSTLSPGDLKKEITQLEEEKHQLHDKIENLKRKTQGMDGFEKLLKVTSLFAAGARDGGEERRKDGRATSPVGRSQQAIPRHFAQVDRAEAEHGK